MSELVQYSAPDPTGGRLVSWAHAASAAGELARMLAFTTIVPEAFRVSSAMSPAQRDAVVGNAAAAILLGDELGLTPIAALRSLYVIRGQVGTFTRAKVALVTSRGHVIWTESQSETSVTVAGHRRDDPDHVERSTWTIERARLAGFIRRGRNGELSQYETQPLAMLYARAAGDVANRIAPDVLLGIPEDADEPSPAGAVGSTVTIQRMSAKSAETRDPAASGESPGTGVTGNDATGSAPDGTTKNDTRDVPGQGETSPATDPVDEPQNDDHGEQLDDVEPTITRPQMNRLQAAFMAVGIRSPERRHAYLSSALGRPVESTSELTVTEASAMIESVELQAETASS